MLSATIITLSAAIIFALTEEKIRLGSLGAEVSVKLILTEALFAAIFVQLFHFLGYKHLAQFFYTGNPCSKETSDGWLGWMDWTIKWAAFAPFIVGLFILLVHMLLIP